MGGAGPQRRVRFGRAGTLPGERDANPAAGGRHRVVVPQMQRDDPFPTVAHCPGGHRILREWQCLLVPKPLSDRNDDLFRQEPSVGQHPPR